MKWFLKNWFLLGLIGLAFLAIPGVILVVLRLCGWDGAINDWLRDKLQISYELRVNPWIALVLLSFPFVLIILYFLKLKRKPIQVPSTFLWKKSVEDLHVNSLFQWLRNNVLLLLQLLVLLFLIYSILGIRIHGSVETSRHYILMIDNSASMSVKDVEPDRLTWAKVQALKEIDAAGDSDYGMVIVFNSKATTLQTYTNDKGKLREAVASIEQTQRPTRIEEALALAESLANPLRSTDDSAVQPEEEGKGMRREMAPMRGISTVVHLFSDGRYAKLSEAALAQLSSRQAGNFALGNLNLRYHMAGKLEKDANDNYKRGDSNNLGIVGLNILKQRPKEGAKREDTQQMLAYVRVANFRAQKASVKLKLDVYVDGTLTHPMHRTIELKPRSYVAGNEEKGIEEKDEPGENERKQGEFQLPPLDPRRNITLYASLEKANDDFALDDQAWLAIGTTRKAKVLIVGRYNRALDAFFDKDVLAKVATVEWMSPADLKTDKYKKRARSGDVDLVIFDRCAPDEEADMPLANTFFIDRPPPPWERGKTVLKHPRMMPSKRQHPLLRYLTTIWDVRTEEAFVFDTVKNLRPEAAKEFELQEGESKKRTLPSVTRLVETSNQVPLLFTLPRGPFTDLVMAFPLINDDGDVVSNWPLETSFPLFFRNVLYTLGNVDDSVRAISVQPGEPVMLRPEAGFDRIKITTPPPNKKDIDLARGERSEVVFAGTNDVGVYRYQARSKDKEADSSTQPMRSFAVNLLDTNESNIEPRAAINIGSERYATGEEKRQTREVWKWILLLALSLLLTEWFIYHRRIAV